MPALDLKRAGASDDGVYLVSLQLSTSQSGVAASLPFFFLLNKNASSAETSAAHAYVETNLVPEPVTAMGVVLVTIGPGTIFPVALGVGGLIAAIACTSGGFIASRLR